MIQKPNSKVEVYRYLKTSTTTIEYCFGLQLLFKTQIHLNWYKTNYRAMNFHGKKLKSHNNFPKMVTKKRNSRKQHFRKKYEKNYKIDLSLLKCANINYLHFNYEKFHLHFHWHTTFRPSILVINPSQQFKYFVYARNEIPVLEESKTKWITVPT